MQSNSPLNVKHILVTAVITIGLSIGGSALNTWRQSAVTEHRLAKLEEASKDNSQSVQKVFTIQGQLDILIGEVRAMRADISAINSHRQ